MALNRTFRSFFFMALPLFLLFSVGKVEAQYMSRGEKDEIFPTHRRYKDSYWHFAPGITRTFTNGQHEATLMDTDSVFHKETYDPLGGTGLYLEVGRYVRLREWMYFEYFDYGLGFKQLKGVEDFTGRYEDSSGVANPSGTRNFNDYYLTLKGGLNNVIQLGDKTFLQNTLGVNADYRVIEGRSLPGYGFPGQYPSKFLGQAFFKIGFGVRVSRKWYFIPSLETPVLNIYQWDNGKSTMEYFHTRYRPVIFSLRFLILQDRPPEDCPPVPGGKDVRDKGDQYRDEMEKN